MQFICLPCNEEKSLIREALRYKKRLKRGQLSLLGNPPPKWLKSGHLLSDYVRKWDSQHFNVKWELYKGSIVLKLYPNIIRNNR